MSDKDKFEKDWEDEVAIEQLERFEKAARKREFQRMAERENELMVAGMARAIKEAGLEKAPQEQLNRLFFKDPAKRAALIEKGAYEFANRLIREADVKAGLAPGDKKDTVRQPVVPESLNYAKGLPGGHSMIITKPSEENVQRAREVAKLRSEGKIDSQKALEGIVKALLKDDPITRY